MFRSEPSASGTLSRRALQRGGSTSPAAAHEYRSSRDQGRMSIADNRGSQGDSNAPAVVAGALAVLVAGALTVGATEAGPLSGQMAIHIAAMNIVAPLLAAGSRPADGARAMLRRGLWLATVVQLAVLWASHSPAVHHAAHASLLSAIFLHGILFLSALAFWFSITSAEASRWQAMLALLVSGKFACLLGVLLIFAPRPLFERRMLRMAGRPCTFGAALGRSASRRPSHDRRMPPQLRADGRHAGGSER